MQFSHAASRTQAIVDDEHVISYGRLDRRAARSSAFGRLRRERRVAHLRRDHQQPPARAGLLSLHVPRSCPRGHAAPPPHQRARPPISPRTRPPHPPSARQVALAERMDQRFHRHSRPTRRTHGLTRRKPWSSPPRRPRYRSPRPHRIPTPRPRKDTGQAVTRARRPFHAHNRGSHLRNGPRGGIEPENDHEKSRRGFRLSCFLISWWRESRWAARGCRGTGRAGHPRR